VLSNRYQSTMLENNNWRIGTIAALAAFAACWLTAVPAEAGQPRLKLEVHAPEETVAGQRFTASFRLSNGGEAITYARTVITIPRAVLLAAPVPDGCFAAFDRDERRLLFEGQLPAGWSGECSLELAAAPDFTNMASLSMETTLPPDGYMREDGQVEIVHPSAPVLFHAGSIGINTASAVVLVYFAVAALAVYFGWRRRPAGRRQRSAYARVMAPVAPLACIGFLNIFAVLAWEDWRTLMEYKEARCQVLDSTVKLEATGSRNDSSVLGNHRIDTYAHMPVFSVRYEFEGRTLQSLGFSTGSRLSYHPAELMTLMEAMQRRSASGGVPCWVDPKAPQTVLLLRGFGGAYIFALLPVLVLAVMGWMLRRGRSRR
jgi:hypothetical protein